MTLIPTARVNALVGYGKEYGLHEAVLGLAVADAGGGGGGGVDVTNIETALGRENDDVGTPTVIGLLKDIANTPGESVVSTITVVGVVANNTDLSNDSSRVEVLIQNKSSTAELYVRVGSTATASASITLTPLSSITISGFRAKLLISLLASAANTTVYYEKVY